MKPRSPLDVIVYQFGKVASTSVVESLRRLPDVRPHQSHFLGEDALRTKLRQLLDYALHPQFLEHGEGQLLRNIRLTRLLNAHKARAAEGRLAIVTIVRDPLDWFRSQLVQEFPGYELGLREVVGAKDNADELDIRSAVSALREVIVEALAFGGGLLNPRFRETLYRDYMPLLEDAKGRLATIYFEHIAAFLRPFFWFHDAVCPLLCLDLQDIQLDETRFFSRHFGWSDYYVFRYEEISQGFDRLLKELGLSPTELVRENLSEAKPTSREIQLAFSPWFSDPVLKGLLKSDYTVAFGYEEYNRS